MAQIGRPGLSTGKKMEWWARFTAGESFTAIARALGKPVGSIYGVVRLRAMSRVLGRAPSTISREIIRNGGPHRYRALDADARAGR